MVTAAGVHGGKKLMSGCKSLLKSIEYNLCIQRVIILSDCVHKSLIKSCFDLVEFLSATSMMLCSSVIVLPPLSKHTIQTYLSSSTRDLIINTSDSSGNPRSKCSKFLFVSSIV